MYNLILCASIGIAIIAPFLTILLLSRRIERISGIRSYWHLFLSSIVFYALHFLVAWNPFNIFLLETQKLLLGNALLMLSTLSAALAMIGLMSTANYSAGRAFLSITSLGLAIPIVLSLGFNYIATPLISLPIAVLTLLLGFLVWCYISLSYFLIWRLGPIIGGKKTPYALIAGIISLIAGFGFLYSNGRYIFNLPYLTSYIEQGLMSFVYIAVGLMASYSSLKLSKETKPLSQIPLEVKLDTNIREIDDMLTGGIPYPSSILLLGVVGSGKTGILLRLSHHRLERGDSVIFVCTNNMPENYRSMMKNIGFDPNIFEERNSLIFIDAYSKRFGIESKEKYCTSMIPYDISVAISNAIKEAKGMNKRLIIVSSLTDVLDECGTRDGLMFLRNVVAKAREAKANLILSLNPQAFPPAVIAIAQEVVDGIIELKLEERGGKISRYIRIPKMMQLEPYTKWKKIET